MTYILETSIIKNEKKKLVAGFGLCTGLNKICSVLL